MATQSHFKQVMKTAAFNPNHADTYQSLRQSIGAMAKNYKDGYVTPMHSHERDQLLFASSGIMSATTACGTWIVPSDRALFIPAGVRHAVSMQGQVEMRTLYISPATIQRQDPTELFVVQVSALMRELILTLSAAPLAFAETKRGNAIINLLGIELSQAPQTSFFVPLPKDRRLQRLCTALLACPSDQRSFADWAELAGASQRTIARLFDKELGMSFHQWRQRVRFYGALEALSNGLSVATVAHNCGYNSPSAFTAAFQKTLGLRPSEVRKNG